MSEGHVKTYQNIHIVFFFFSAMASPIMHGIWYFGLNIRVKWMNWTFENKRRQFLLDFHSVVKHQDASPVNCRNLAQAFLFK